MPKLFRSRSIALKPISLACLGLILSGGNLQATEQLALNTIRRPSEVERQEVKPPADAVLVKGFAFTGNTLVSTAELDVLLSSYIGQTCGLDKLREAAARITEEYHRRGMSLAKAYVPAQQIDGGIVNIAVLEGRIGRLSIEGNRNYSTNFIRRYLTAGNPERQLTIEQLEKGLLLLNSNFTDLKVTANFVPGKEPGTVDVMVKVEDEFPLRLTITSNNYGSENVSRFRFGAQGEWVNALIPGSKLTLSALVGDQPDTMDVVSGSYEMPINSLGTTIGGSGYIGNFDMGKEFAELGIHSDEKSVDAFISHPLIRRRMSNLSVKAGARASNTWSYYLDGLSSGDKTRAIYLQFMGDQVFWGGRGFFGLTWNQGLGTSFGGSSGTASLPTSRTNSSNEFSRINLDLGRYQPLSDVFSATLRMSGQWSESSLMIGEEWSIGGVNSVHGYASGEASGDKGYMASLAITAAPLEKPEQLRISAYLDHGYAFKQYCSTGSTQVHELTGVGLGFASHLDYFSGTDLRLDIGMPLSPSDNYLNESPIIYFETAFRF